MAEDHRRRKASVLVPAILILLAVAGLAAGLLGLGGYSLTPHKLYNKLGLPLVRLLSYLAAGLFVGQLIESLGWTSKIARWIRPLTRWGRLKEESGAAFVASFLSGIVANTMLMNALLAERITRRELKIAYVLNNGLPMFLVHLPTTFFIVVSLAGGAGFVYLAITFVAACLRSFGAVAFARFTLQPAPAASVQESRPQSAARVRQNALLSRFAERFVRLVLYTIPIYVLIFLLNEWGAFTWLRDALASKLAIGLFPIEAAGLVIFAFAAEFGSGMAAAGAMLDGGALTVKQAGLALLVGTILSTPIRAIRHQLPTHAGIFNLGLGSELLVLSQGLRVLTLALVALPYVVWG
jgi:hypothetical protein